MRRGRVSQSPGRHRDLTGGSPGPHRDLHRARHRGVTGKTAVVTGPVTGTTNTSSPDQRSSSSGKKPGPSPDPSPGNVKIRGVNLPPHRTPSRTLFRARHRDAKKITGAVFHPGVTGPCPGPCSGAVTGPFPGAGIFAEIWHLRKKCFLKVM